MSNWFKKLELGSAQFGLDYGINNGKRVEDISAKHILNRLNIECPMLIDTAPVYGVSEKTIENIMSKDNRVISKLLPLKTYTVQEVLAGLKNTCDKFKNNLYGLVIHDADDLNQEDYKIVIEELISFRKKNIKIGVSVYDVSQVFESYNIFEFDMIQIPLSPLDQRFNTEEFIRFTKFNEIEVHVRSIFLQGLLLKDKENIPVSLIKVIPYIDAINDFSIGLGVSVYDACLLFAFNKSWVNHVLVGLDNITQANTLIDSMKQLMGKEYTLDFSMLNCTDVNIINPVNWSHEN